MAYRPPHINSQQTLEPETCWSGLETSFRQESDRPDQPTSQSDGADELDVGAIQPPFAPNGEWPIAGLNGGDHFNSQIFNKKDKSNDSLEGCGASCDARPVS